MRKRSKAVIARSEDRPREQWDDPLRGRVSWFTLFSRDITPTERMSAGIAELVPGGGSRLPHSHAEPEIYFIIEGTGILTIDGEDSVVAAGSAVFIPGDAEHALRNETAAALRLLYVFPTDRFSDVVYRFSGEDGAGNSQSAGRIPGVSGPGDRPLATS